MNLVVGADLRPPRQVGVGHHSAAAFDFDWAIDDDVGTDGDIGIDLRLKVNDCGGVNTHGSDFRYCFSRQDAQRARKDSYLFVRPLASLRLCASILCSESDLSPAKSPSKTHCHLEKQRNLSQIPRFRST